MAMLSVSEDRPLPFGGPGAMDRDSVGVTWDAGPRLHEHPGSRPIPDFVLLADQPG